MNAKQMISILEVFPPKAQLAVMQGEFCYYYTPKHISIKTLGVYKNMKWKKGDFFPEINVREIGFNCSKEKLIKKQKFACIE